MHKGHGWRSEIKWSLDAVPGVRSKGVRMWLCDIKYSQDAFQWVGIRCGSVTVKLQAVGMIEICLANIKRHNSN